MNNKELEYMRPYRLKLFLKNNIFYSGTIIEIYDDSIMFLDKFDNKVLLNINLIERVEVQNE